LGVAAAEVKPIRPETILSYLQAYPKARRIFLVDDDLGFVQLIQRIIESCNGQYQIQRAYDGEQALELIRENPPEDPNELKKLKREFAREFRRYRLQMRYVNGYSRRYQNYMQLQRNMERLAGVFVNLHEKFNELIDNLTNERQYLHCPPPPPATAPVSLPAAIYPNPATQEIQLVNLPADSAARTASLYDARGRIVMTRPLPRGAVRTVLPLGQPAEEYQRPASYRSSQRHESGRRY
jgi:CheY-like chemotaxis protein